MAKLATVLLAAGEARRFGSPKQLARLADGQTLLQRALGLAQTLGDAHCYTVLGAYAEQLRPWVSTGQVIENPAWADGLGGSIACAMEHLDSSGEAYDGVLFFLADQVALSRPDLQRLRAAFTPSQIVCARFETAAGTSVNGVPALFPASCFAALRALSGPQGARHLLRGELLPVHGVDMPTAAVDIDTPAALAAFNGR